MKDSSPLLNPVRHKPRPLGGGVRPAVSRSRHRATMRIAAHSLASGREIMSRRRHRVTMPRSRRWVHPSIRRDQGRGSRQARPTGARPTRGLDKLDRPNGSPGVGLDKLDRPSGSPGVGLDKLDRPGLDRPRGLDKLDRPSGSPGGGLDKLDRPGLDRPRGSTDPPLMSAIPPELLVRSSSVSLVSTSQLPAPSP